MINPFRLKGPFGSEYGIDADDILRTKKALSSLGHLPGPKGPITPYADRWMIDGLKSFQRSNGLAVDGIMKPGGPTAKALGRALGDKADPQILPARHPIPLPENDDGTFSISRPLGPNGHGILSWTPSVFGTLSDVGHGRRNLPRDVLAVRRALAWSGDLPAERAAIPANAGSDGHADLFDAIERFQTRNDLKTDGWMGPNDETARALDTAVAERVSAHEDAAAGNRKDNASDKAKDSVTQVAMAGPVINLLLRQLPRLLPGVAAGVAGQKAIEETLKSKGENASPRSEIADPMPSSPPPLEPDDNRFPNKEEYPAEGPKLPGLEGLPAKEPTKPEPLIFEALREEIRKELSKPSQANPGDKWTIKGNELIAGDVLDEILDEYPDEVKDAIKHMGGAGKKEEYMPDEQTGMKGSSFPDITLEDIRYNTKLRALTGLMLKDGRTPISRERRQVYGVRDKSDSGDIVAALPKLRPGMDIDEFKNRAKEALRPYIHAWIGKPK